MDANIRLIGRSLYIFQPATESGDRAMNHSSSPSQVGESMLGAFIGHVHMVNWKVATGQAVGFNLS